MKTPARVHARILELHALGKSPMATVAILENEGHATTIALVTRILERAGLLAVAPKPVRRVLERRPLPRAVPQISRRTPPTEVVPDAPAMTALIARRARIAP